MRGYISFSQIFVLVLVVIFLFGDFFKLKQILRVYFFKLVKYVNKELVKLKNRKKGS